MKIPLRFRTALFATVLTFSFANNAQGDPLPDYCAPTSDFYTPGPECCTACDKYSPNYNARWCSEYRNSGHCPCESPDALDCRLAVTAGADFMDGVDIPIETAVLLFFGNLGNRVIEGETFYESIEDQIEDGDYGIVEEHGGDYERLYQECDDVLNVYEAIACYHRAVRSYMQNHGDRTIGHAEGEVVCRHYTSVYNQVFERWLANSGIPHNRRPCVSAYAVPGHAVVELRLCSTTGGSYVFLLDTMNDPQNDGLTTLYPFNEAALELQSLPILPEAQPDTLDTTSTEDVENMFPFWDTDGSLGELEEYFNSDRSEETPDTAPSEEEFLQVVP